MAFLCTALALLGLALSLTPHAAGARPIVQSPGYLADDYQTGVRGRGLMPEPVDVPSRHIRSFTFDPSLNTGTTRQMDNNRVAGRRLVQGNGGAGPMNYLGGEVMTDEVHIYPIYIGYQSNQDAVPFWLNNMMVNMNNHSLWNVVTRYSQTDSSGTQKFVSGRITLANILYIDALTTPIALTYPNLLDQLNGFIDQLIFMNALPYDPQGVYMVIGGQNAGLAPPPELFMFAQSCAYHGFVSGSYKFGYVPDYTGIQRCQWTGLGGPSAVSPSGDDAIDAMANFLFTNLANIVTDPTEQGWQDLSTFEMGAKCFGVAQLQTDPNSGVNYSQMFGRFPYLVQDLWSIDLSPNPNPNLPGSLNQVGCLQGI